MVACGGRVGGGAAAWDDSNYLSLSGQSHHLHPNQTDARTLAFHISDITFVQSLVAQARLLDDEPRHRWLRAGRFVEFRPLGDGGRHVKLGPTREVANGLVWRRIVRSRVQVDSLPLLLLLLAARTTVRAALGPGYVIDFAAV